MYVHLIFYAVTAAQYKCVALKLLTIITCNVPTFQTNSLRLQNPGSSLRTRPSDLTQMRSTACTTIHACDYLFYTCAWVECILIAINNAPPHFADPLREEKWRNLQEWPFWTCTQVLVVLYTHYV